MKTLARLGETFASSRRIASLGGNALPLPAIPARPRRSGRHPREAPLPLTTDEGTYERFVTGWLTARFGNRLYSASAVTALRLREAGFCSPPSAASAPSPFASPSAGRGCEAHSSSKSTRHL